MTIKNVGCLICQQKEWISYLNTENIQWEKLSLENEIDQTLKPIHKFNELINNFHSSCAECEGMPIVCLMGRTGSGKSTLLNILAGRKPSYSRSNIGTKEIYFENPVCEVGSGISSLTKFCTCIRLDDAIFVDFAGFFDNRAGQLQIVQHILLHEITRNRKFKLIAVKDIRTTRDAPFLDFLNLPWIDKNNTLVVMTHTSSENEIDWEKYGEGRIKSKFKVVMMPLGVKGSEFKSFRSKLKEKIRKLEFSNQKISLEISSQIFKFQVEALNLLKDYIDNEIRKIFDENIQNIIIKPYDVEYYKRVFYGKFSLKEALISLEECGIIKENTNVKPLYLLEKHWTLLVQFAKDPDLDCRNWGQISPSSQHHIVKLQQTLSDFTPPDFPPLETGDLVKDLKKWNKLCYTHYIEHASYKARAMSLITQGDDNSFKELSRLAGYRQETYQKIIKVWSPLEVRFLQEVDRENQLTSSGKFFDTMKMKDAKSVVQEILRFSSTNSEDLSYFSKKIYKNISGVALADGAVTLGTWAMQFVNAGKFHPALGVTVSTTGVLLGVLAGAAAGAFAYHLYLTNRQLQKLRAIGFDFSFIRVESSIWTDIAEASRRKDAEAVRHALATFEKEFRLFISSTREGVIQTKRKLQNAKLEGVDISKWQKLIDNVDSMSQSIFIEMKAREASFHGCQFREHEWENRSLLSLNLDIFNSLSCCSFYIKKMMLECRHCGFLCHRDQECKLLALQIPCKSLVGEQVSNCSLTSVDSVKLRSEAAKESLDFIKNQHMVTSAYLSKLIYERALVTDDELYVQEIGDIKYLISLKGTTAFVIVRGTVITNISNWLVNAQVVMDRVGDSQGRTHAGFYKAANSINESVWHQLDILSPKNIVFAGHSMGGAVAHILHLKAVLDCKRSSVYTISYAFGSPLLFDKQINSLIKRCGGKTDNFVTFANDLDPVPGIFQSLNSKIIRDVLKAFKVTKLTSTLVNLATEEITKDYMPLGRYIFFDSEGYWQSTNPKRIMAQLNTKSHSFGVVHHEMEEYYTRLIIFLDSMSTRFLLEQKENQFG